MKSISLWKAVLVGFGQIGATYGANPLYSRYVEYPTHAHVLRAHRAFDWQSVVDPSEKALQLAKKEWGLEYAVRDPKELPLCDSIDVAVIATPPDTREKIIRSFPNLKAVIVEKPLGSSLHEARAFLDYCSSRKINVQVNITRRADRVLRALADGGLRQKIGDLRAANGVYGNGILNIATHLIDLVRMILGEVDSVQALSHRHFFSEGPIENDINLPFCMYLEDGIPIILCPVRFSDYRECSLDLWGSKGRLQIIQEGLYLAFYPKAPCRSFSGANEIPSDNGQISRTGYGEALYFLYDNLNDVIRGESTLYSSGENALETTMIIEAVLTSHKNNGKKVTVRELP